METREFRFSEGSSDKFWKICVDGTSFTVQFGRTGTAGQTQTKEFASDSAATQAAEKLIQEKVRKGYVEQGNGDGTPLPAVTAAVKARPEPAAGSEAAPAGKAAPAPKVAPAAKVARAVVDVPVEPAPVTPALAVVDPDQPRSLDLEPGDWARATYKRQPVPKPEPPSFDLKEAVSRVARLTRSQSNWRLQWENARIAPVLTTEEARFWIEAMTDSRYDRQARQVAAELAKQKFDKTRSLKRALETAQSQHTPEAIKPIANLYPLTELVDTAIKLHDDAAGKKQYYWGGPQFGMLCIGFGMYVVPYLTEAEITQLRDRLRPLLAANPWPLLSQQGFYEAPHPAYHIAAQLGMHDELLATVQAWPDDAYTNTEGWHDHYHQPQEIVLGLGSRELVEHHFRRLKLRLTSPDRIRAWLAHTGYDALDVVRDTILGVTNKEDAEQLVTALARVHAPEAAPVMLELMLSSKAPGAARRWLDENPAHAAAGLIPVAAGRGKLADAAVEYLRSMKRKGGEALLTAAVERAEEGAAARVRTLVLEHQEAGGEPFDDASTPEWLKSAVAEAAKKKAPTWISPADLPAIAAEGRRLNEAQTAAALAALAASKLEEPHPLVTALKEHGDRASLAEFSWRLFERWLSEGGPAKEKWAMQAVGHWGGDASALKLTPMIRNWPGESQHQRAVLGLECLRTIGTDTALMQINGIAQKVQFKGLKAKAGECMEGIAKDRGLTRAQLEDRIVPDCDLDERGSRVFDFGPRQFRMVLGPGMKPMVRDADGKIKPDLPKPTAKDDAALAAQATADWKLLKKQVAEVVKVQAVRLEQAMVTGRRWPVEEFELLLVHHPLMTNLVRLVIWGVFGPDGKLEETFRVTEDMSYADKTDDVYELPRDRQVAIVHPLQLSDADKAAWGEVLGDYEIVPPFSQIGRPVFGLEGAEAGEKELNRWKKVEIPPQSLVFTLEKLGWQRGIPEDGGVFYSHSKPFYGADVTAIVEYEEGVPVGYMEGWDDQNITRCYFIPGIWKPDWYPDHKKTIQLGKVDPVVISEVLNDLTTVASKGK